jgi:hypothetical protein
MIKVSDGNGESNEAALREHLERSQDDAGAPMFHARPTWQSPRPSPMDLISRAASISRLLKDAIDQILNIRHMPPPASRSANAACIESGGDSTQVGHSGRTDGIQDRQRVCSEQGGILCLSAPPRALAESIIF